MTNEEKMIKIKEFFTIELRLGMLSNIFIKSKNFDPDDVGLLFKSIVKAIDYPEAIRVTSNLINELACYDLEYYDSYYGDKLPKWEITLERRRNGWFIRVIKDNIEKFIGDQKQFTDWVIKHESYYCKSDVVSWVSLYFKDTKL